MYSKHQFQKVNGVMICSCGAILIDSDLPCKMALEQTAKNIFSSEKINILSFIPSKKCLIFETSQSRYCIVQKKKGFANIQEIS